MSYICQTGIHVAVEVPYIMAYSHWTEQDLSDAQVAKLNAMYRQWEKRGLVPTCCELHQLQDGT